MVDVVGFIRFLAHLIIVTNMWFISVDNVYRQDLRFTSCKSVSIRSSFKERCFLSSLR